MSIVIRCCVCVSVTADRNCCAFQMRMSDHMCNCALFLSYISFYWMGVCLCLYRTTWTACRYFTIAFIYLLDIFPPLPVQSIGYTVSPLVFFGPGGMITKCDAITGISIVSMLQLIRCVLNAYTVVQQGWKTAQWLYYCNNVLLLTSVDFVD